MNSFLKKLLCAGLCGCMLLTVAGCDKPTPSEPGDVTDDPDTPPTQTYDTETRALLMSTGALDQNFNPFFYTSANDGNMIANTQLGMLTLDEGGHLVAGQDWATVALDYRTTMYTGKQVGTGEVTTDGASAANGRTEYEFVIKNGIKFSDGEDLTAADVLFNLYVYLDPNYTGSNTIYSTDIQGLKAYRAQDPTISDDSDASVDALFEAKASRRIQDLADWANGDIASTPEIEADYEALKAELSKELETDWTSIYSSWYENYKNTHKFTAAWQAYLYEQGMIWEQEAVMQPGTTKIERRFNDDNGNGVRDEDLGERFYTTLDPNADGSDPDHQHFIDAVEEATTAEEIAKYLAANADATEEIALTELQKQAVVELAYNYWSDKTMVISTLGMRACAYTFRQNLVNEERSNYFASLEGGVTTISGISVYEATGAELTSSFNGAMSETYVASETYSVLKIVINGIDPKAIYNFSFSVSPLHYYSSTNYNGDNLVTKAKEHYNDTYDPLTDTVDTRYYGVEVGDNNFFTNVLQAESKNGVPVGAGPYIAANKEGNPASSKSEFDNNNIVHFARNNYFETVGANINNANIKYLDYKVITEDQIMTSLTSGKIDLGMPSATANNQTEITSHNFLATASYPMGGYGYVGINPKAVPEYQVRQAIMKALDTTLAVGYFGSSFAQSLYRPMTTTSWVYDYATDAMYEEYPSIVYELDNTEGNNEIRKLVESAGYTLVNGKYVKNRTVTTTYNGQTVTQGNAATGSTLKLTFTIAGDSNDHPAFTMFNEAAKRLNNLGFDITVKNDPQALSNLAAGALDVWAAAWTSSVDPDPYQIYHKDSKATSVNNWNYSQILNNPSDWGYEYNIVQQLSDLIDEGRQSLDENVRAGIYIECLDLIMDFAVEMPTYQRSDLCVYNKTVIDANSLVKNPSHYVGLFDRIWEINYV